MNERNAAVAKKQLKVAFAANSKPSANNASHVQGKISSPSKSLPSLSLSNNKNTVTKSADRKLFGHSASKAANGPQRISPTQRGSSESPQRRKKESQGSNQFLVSNASNGFAKLQLNAQKGPVVMTYEEEDGHYPHHGNNPMELRAKSEYLPVTGDDDQIEKVLRKARSARA